MKKKSYYNIKSISIIFWIVITIYFAYCFGIEAIKSNSNILELVKSAIMVTIGICSNINIISNKITHKDAIEKGIRIPGVIIRPEQEITYDEDGFKKKHYYLYVKYVDPKTNEEKEFKTEELAFNPFKKLKSNKCNVYIYNETIIADDFEIAKNKEERVFEENNNFKPEKEKKKIDLITVLAIIMIVIASIIFICALLKKL